MKIKKILVSQPKPESEKSPYYDIEKKYGVNIVFRQFFKNEPVDVKDFRKQRIDILAHTAIIFTAKLGIDNFFRLCKELRVTVPDDMKYFCTSEKISLYLQHYIQYRKRKIFFGADSKFESLISVMEKHKDEKFLLVGADSQNEEQKAQESGRFKALEEKGFTFDKAVMYRTVNNYFQPDETFDYDMIVFYNPADVKSLQERNCVTPRELPRLRAGRHLDRMPWREDCGRHQEHRQAETRRRGAIASVLFYHSGSRQLRKGESQEKVKTDYLWSARGTDSRRQNTSREKLVLRLSLRRGILS